MNKLKTVLANVAICTVVAPAGHASSPHLPTSTTPVSHTTRSMGNFQTSCISLSGSAIAESINMPVNGHYAQVILLASTNENGAECSTNGLNNETVSNNYVMQFTLAKGDGKYLLVIVARDGVSQNQIFYVPGSPLSGLPHSSPLLSNGHGVYSIPLGVHNGNGIPAGSRISKIAFSQISAPRNCELAQSALTNFVFNKRPLPIDTSAKTSTCGTSCE